MSESIVLPYDLKGKTLAVAAQVMGNFKALREAVEGIAAASTASDIYQAGVLASTDWVESAFVSSAGTGELEVTFPASAAWLPAPGGGLVRTFTPGATTKLKPPSLPVSGGFRKIGIELTASGNAAVLSMVSGTEQASEALAIANPPAVTAGKVRVFDYVLQNSAGVYSTHEGRDRRPWARGAYARAIVSGIEQPLGTHAIAGLTQRVECSGGPKEAYFEYFRSAGTDEATAPELWVDGSLLTHMDLNGGFRVVGVSAGSHLFEVRVTESEANVGPKTRATVYAALLIRETVAAVANNGTA